MAWGPQLGIVLAVGRSLQIGPITARSSPDCLTARPNLGTEIGSRVEISGQRRLISASSGRVAALSDCVQFAGEVLLKSLHTMDRYAEVEKLDNTSKLLLN